jgi:NAD(P)-dependent dehydrogenase (short-subunit alcohol dehydrogenase family)
MQDLKGRTAFVTGAGSGVGHGISLALAKEGVHVAVADLHEQSARRVAEEIVAKGGAAFPVQVDVTSPSSLEAAAESVVARTGAVHLLCNNAGVMPAPGPSAAHRPEDWEYVFSVNVFGVANGVRAFLPHLRRSAPDAHIVNTASLGGLFVVDGPSLGIYLSSKYACVGYSECLRDELVSERIGVSILCPGMVASDLPRTSARNRPERYGTQPDPTTDPATDADLDDMTRDRRTISPEQAGEIMIRGIRDDCLYIVTHPDAKKHLEGRVDELLKDFAWAERWASPS